MKDEAVASRPTNWKVRAVYNPVNMTYDVYIIERTEWGVYAMTRGGDIVRVVEGKEIPEFITLKESNDDFLEIFMRVEYYGHPTRT